MLRKWLIKEALIPDACLSPLQEGAGTCSPLRSKAVNLERRMDWKCLGRRVSYKLCSCWALAFFSGACVPFPPLQGVCPPAMGHGVCREASCTFLAFTYWNMGTEIARLLSSLEDGVRSDCRWCSLLPSHPTLFSRTLCLSITPRTMQFPTDKLWKQCLGKGW